jgi:hypothetical protein
MHEKRAASGERETGDRGRDGARQTGLHDAEDDVRVSLWNSEHHVSDQSL